jgi:hypothetical protein
MLQTDLNERTERYEKRFATAAAAEKPQLHHEAQELATEQGRLAELVQSLVTRDNEDEK